MFMITPSPSSSEYKAEFPALTTFKNPQQKTKHSWKIHNSNVVGPVGSPNQITNGKATLNWQSENAVAQNNSTVQSTIAPLFTPYSNEEVNTQSDIESSSYDELSSNHEFEHLFMVDPEQAKRVHSDIEDANSRAETQDQEQGRNVFTNTDSKLQFTFDDIPPSKWREITFEMLSWCSAELQYYNIDMVIKTVLNQMSRAA
ncbi:hypothetical protein L1987_29845 [Smallanthus sonchifolius]|uniref:Uncharacterized protein n=1 Tax=Smallanthus sonchifolius TaxID=185202 RepID=A0ACB9I2P9_9ASTR|nr:hypothetical protein L1987_29845 [Smallanthus sonchifolius]